MTQIKCIAAFVVALLMTSTTCTPSCPTLPSTVVAKAPSEAVPLKEPTCTSPWKKEIPKAVDAAKEATLPVRFGPGGAFSAVRVSEDLLLTAAHCIVGFKGDTKRGPFRIELGGDKIEIKIAEMGDYNGTRGRMNDWALFRVDDPSVLSDVTIASFPDKQAMDEALQQQASSIRQCGLPVWTISYPAPSIRRPPRPPIPGKVQRFLSRGFLQSHAAHRELAALAWEHGILYDQQVSPELPEMPLDVKKVWEANAKEFLHEIYQDYKTSGDPLIFHSADFSPGSSGGGVFVEATGNLLGVLPYGTAIGGDPRKGWPGFYSAYRIDFICAESSILSSLDKCKKLVQTK